MTISYAENLVNLSNTIENLTRANTSIQGGERSRFNNEEAIDKLLSEVIKLTSSYVQNIPKYDALFE